MMGTGARTHAHTYRWTSAQAWATSGAYVGGALGGRPCGHIGLGGAHVTLFGQGGGGGVRGGGLRVRLRDARGRHHRRLGHDLACAEQLLHDRGRLRMPHAQQARS
jgi:hypothetical protein